MEGKKSYRIAKRPLYREEIKEALMEAIVSGELAPGERIVETRWAKELGVSQSPIREAIRELEMIGLVENIPYKGCIVRKLTRKDIEDTYKVRIALETMAICEEIQGDVQSMLPGLQQHFMESNRVKLAAKLLRGFIVQILVKHAVDKILQIIGRGFQV